MKSQKVELEVDLPRVSQTCGNTTLFHNKTHLYWSWMICTPHPILCGW